MFSVFFNEFRSFYRQGSNLFFCILFPSLLVFLLGTLLSQFDISDYAVGEINLHYYCNEKNTAVEQFLTGLEDKGLIVGKKTHDLQASLEELKSKNIDCVAEVKGGNINLYMGFDAVKNRTVKALFDSFSQMEKSYITVAMSGLNTEVKIEKNSFVSSKDLGINRTMIDYYAVAMLVMILFMGSIIGGAETFHSEKKYHTDIRLHISPLSRTCVFFGKIMGSMPMVCVQIGTVMLVSTVFYDAHYCVKMTDNLILIAMFVAVSLAVFAVGMFVSMFINFSPVILFTPLMWIMMFVSGTFSKEIYVKGVTELMPIYIVQKAAFDLTVFGNGEKAWHIFCVSMAIFLVFLILGAIKFSRKGESK